MRNECLRMLASLHLDPARSKLIGGFIDNYLRLSAEEMQQYERAFAKLTPEEQESTMGLVSSWELKGIEKGRQEGKEKLVVRLITKRFGSVPSQVTERLDQMTSEQLDELGEALLDFTSLADLNTWLAQRIQQ